MQPPSFIFEEVALNYEVSVTSMKLSLYCCISS